MALLDLLGKSLDKPVAALLNSVYLESCSVAALVRFDTINETLLQIDKFIDRGFQTLKIKTTQTAQSTVEFLHAVNEKFHAKINYRIDTNGQWSINECREFNHKSIGLRVEYLEQPLPKGMENEMQLLTAQSGIPIALDESVGTLEEARTFLRRHELIQIIKPMTIGGIIPAYDHIRKAREAGVKCVISSAMDSSLACSYYLALSATLKNDIAIGIGNCILIENDILAEPLKFENGSVSLMHNRELGTQLAQGLTDKLKN